MEQSGTAFGRELFDARHLDGAIERVSIQQLPIDVYPEYGALLGGGNDYALAGFYCSQNEDWARTLEPGSVLAINAKGDELNADFFSQWTQGRQARLKRTNPKLFAELERRNAEILTRLESDLSRMQSPTTPSASGSPSSRSADTVSPS